MSNLYVGDNPLGSVVLTYDTEATPTKGSKKALASGGAFNALSNKADKNIVFTVTLSAGGWIGSASPYTQPLTIQGTTVNSKVDLQPDSTVIQQMVDDGTVALYISNDSGTLTAYAVGEKPTVELTVQATIAEVLV